MRILLFAQAFFPIVGGAECFLDRLARELVDRGHEVCVLAARVRHADNRLEAPYRLNRYRRPFSKRVLPRHTVLYLLRTHLSFRPDLIHSHGAYPTGYSAASFAKLCRVPLVIRPIGGDILPNERIQQNSTLRKRMISCLHAANGVIAQSLELEELIDRLGVDASLVRRIPNGADLSQIRPVEPGRAGPVIAAMGMFFKKKGFDILIEAFRQLHTRHPNACLVIGGEGVEEDLLRDQIDKANLNNAVELPGILDHAAKCALFERSALFVSSARREPFSNANLEALAAGLPLIATAVGGNREIVEQGVNGLLVPPEDPQALCAAIEQVLLDPTLRHRMGVQSRQKAHDYDWSTIADQYEAFYEDVLAGRVAAPAACE